MTAIVLQRCLIKLFGWMACDICHKDARDIWMALVETACWYGHRACVLAKAKKASAASSDGEVKP